MDQSAYRLAPDDFASGEPAHASALLEAIIAAHSGPRISLQELLDGIRGRAFGPLLMITALPEVLPLPVVGMSAFIGIPLMLFAGQMVICFDRPKIPAWLGRRSFDRTQIAALVSRIVPRLRQVERLVRPRWQPLTARPAEPLIGLIVLILALIIALPIPFGNMAPAIAVFIIAVGLTERDGLVVAIGMLSSLLIVAIMAGAIWALLGSVASTLLR